MPHDAIRASTPLRGANRGLLGWRGWRGPTLAPAAYRRVTLGALVALVFIVVTGGAVRLTGSGLGCPDWPTCAEGRLVPVPEAGYHAMVEFVNRAITGLVSLAVMLAVLGSMARRPRRLDLVWLSLGLVAGVIGQIVLGGLTVLYDLRPQFVMGHFLASMVLLANATVLHERAGLHDQGATVGRPTAAAPTVVRLGRLAVGLAALVVFVGTLVTSSGPHGGDPDAERFSFLVADVARLHGIAVVAFLAVVAWSRWYLSRSVRSSKEEPAPLARHRADVVLVVGLTQAGIGYLQYFTGVPVVLVGAHIAGAAALWVVTVRFQQACSRAPRA